LLLMLIGLGCAVGCAVVPSYFSAAPSSRIYRRKDFRIGTLHYTE